MTASNARAAGSYRRCFSSDSPTSSSASAFTASSSLFAACCASAAAVFQFLSLKAAFARSSATRRVRAWSGNSALSFCHAASWSLGRASFVAICAAL